MKHKVLCVDDEIDNVEALERLFRKKYEVLKATSGRGALDLLAATKQVSLILTDQRMPGMTGVELLRESINTHPQAMRILLTGYTDVESVVDAINAGEVYRYLTKPWDPIDLANTVDQAIEKFELTRQLQAKNEELRQALAELDLLNQAKTQFMVLISHELKTPLTSILSFADLLRETSLDADQMRYLLRIQQSSQRLGEIVFDVLLLLQAETGLLPVHAAPQKAGELQPELTAKMTSLMEKKRLTLHWGLGSEQVVADRKLIQEVLARTVHNAIKFSRDQSHIEVSAHQPNSNYLVIEVRNQGEKIGPETIARILEPFTLNEDMMNHSQGLGLGLSLCQAVLKRCGSGLSIESDDEGVSVRFALPLAGRNPDT